MKTICAIVATLMLSVTSASANDLTKQQVASICNEQWGYGSPHCRYINIENHTEIMKGGKEVVLIVVYALYSINKICYELRQGYDFVYISQVEMNRAKQYASTVEKVLHVPASVATEWWTEFQKNTEIQTKMYNFKLTISSKDAESARRVCQDRYLELEDWNNLLSSVSSPASPKKDF